MVRALDFAVAHFGRERYAGGHAFARHRHADGYAAIVLAGGYLEAGDSGRRHVEAGDVLVHRPFETHFNSMSSRGADVLNLPLVAGAALPAAGRVADPDRLARLAARDLAAASEALIEAFAPAPPPLSDWPDLLATACRDADELRIGDWARRHGLAAGTASRGFARAFGVTPARYRVEARTRSAWRAIVDTSETLAAIAAQAGFADQPHMTRCVVGLTGRAPGFWRQRRQIRSRPG